MSFIPCNLSKSTDLSELSLAFVCTDRRLQKMAGGLVSCICLCIPTDTTRERHRQAKNTGRSVHTTVGKLVRHTYFYIFASDRAMEKERGYAKDTGKQQASTNAKKNQPFTFGAITLFVSTYVSLCLTSVRLQAQSNSQKPPPSNDNPIFTETITVDDSRPGKGLQKESYQKIPLNTGENRTATKLSEVVEKQHGVKVNRFGAPGTFSSLSIRGSNPNQTGVYIHGIAINSPLGGAVNLESLALEAFNSVEFYRSYTPLHLQGSHIGGAVDLVPRQLGDKELRWFLTGSITSLQGGSLGGGLQLPWTLQSLKLEGSRNHYTYHDNNGTPLFNTADDRLSKRKNEGYQFLSYTGLYSFQFAEQKLKALIDVLAKERGIAGIVGAPLTKVSLQEYRVLSKFSHQAGLRENLFLDSSFAIHSDTSILKDPERELGASIQANERTAVRIEQSLMPSLYFFTDQLTLRALLHATQNDITLNEEELAERFEEIVGLAISYSHPALGQILIQEEWQFTQDHLQAALTNQLFHQATLGDKKRQDYITDNRFLRLGIFPIQWLQMFLSAQYDKAQSKRLHLELYAMLSHGKRTPAITEAYGDGRLVRGNPSLDSEQSLSQSYGLSGSLTFSRLKLYFSTSFFRTVAEELIIFVQNSPNTIYAENVGGAILQGIEGELQCNLRPYILSNLRFTYLETQDKGKLPYYRNKRLPFRPQYTVEYYLEGGLTQWKSFINIHWLGSLYRDRLNSKREFVSNRWRLDLGMHYFFAKNRESRFSFTVKNLLNDRRHSDLPGFPLPDRNYEIQFHKEFSYAGDK